MELSLTALVTIALAFLFLLGLCLALFMCWKNEEALLEQSDAEVKYYRGRFLKLVKAFDLGDDYEDAEFDISEDEFLANHKAKMFSSK